MSTPEDDAIDEMFPDGEAHMSEPTRDVLLVWQADGYEIRKELVTYMWNDDEKAQVSESAYAPDGGYIGTPEYAAKLRKRGVMPELSRPDNNVCSIGFCEEEQKWYGWSHRAFYGFGIGDSVKEGDLCATSGWTDEYLAEHPEEDVSLPVGFVAETLDDCRRMAVAFAGAVS